MEFAVKTWASGKARAGTVKLGSCLFPIETPALLHTTNRGLPFFISPDLMNSLPSPDSRIVLVNPLHFLEGPSPKIISNIGGLSSMIGLEGYAITTCFRDSISCIPECLGANKFGACFETPCGRRVVKPAKYMEMIASMKPDTCVSLADEVPPSVSEKRNRISVDRTLRWLDECIVSNTAGVNMFGAIVGGSSVENRRRCAEEVVKRNMPGYWLGGFGLGENSGELPILLNSVTDILPEEVPRQVSGLGHPGQVLEAVSAGIDLFESPYIYNATVGGFGLNFPLDDTESEHRASWSDPMNVDLNDAACRDETGPIVDGCGCHTCENHTRAYMYHLMKSGEMLARTLLEIHNTHQYLLFFRSIRKAVKGDRFEQLRKRFVQDVCSNSFPS